jgi:hypothetical protein
MHDLSIKRLLEGRRASEQHSAQILSEAQRRRESDGEAARQLSRLLIAEREKSLPADVPLHKRGFGVMEEDGAS